MVARRVLRERRTPNIERPILNEVIVGCGGRLLWRDRSRPGCELVRMIFEDVGLHLQLICLSGPN